MPRIRILTNFERFPKSWSTPSGETGDARTVHTFTEFVRNTSECDLIIINVSASLVMKLSAFFALFPFLRKPIVAVDLVLRQCQSEWRRRLKKWLFSRIDYFVHYFKDLSYYDKYYGIGAGRSGYVAFKPNIRHRYDSAPNSEGEYVLCIGWSLRDYDTFFEAVEKLPYPAAIPRPNFEQLRANGSRFSRDLEELPRHVKVLDDEGTTESLVRIIKGARLVVLPILSSSLCASGISTYLDSMLLRKCVIISTGPGVSDLLSNEALSVPPEEPQALAKMIERAWEDDALRRRTAEAGYHYASSLGGEPELIQRILGQTIGWLKSR